jgi:phosphate-selective porin OprO and OprP
MGKSHFARGAALIALASAGGVSSAFAQAASTPPPPVTVTTQWRGAPQTNEEDRQFKVNGRIQYDYFDINQDFANPATADVEYAGTFARRAFIGVEGRFTQHWRYNVKFDLSPGQSDTSGQGNEVRLDDAYLEYAGDDFSVFIGQNNAVAHMEDRTSSNYTPFNERSMIDQAFGFGKIFGVAFAANGGNWSAGAAYHTDTLNNGQTVNTDEQHYFIGRGTFAPIYSRTPDGITLLHLGVSARHREGGTGFLSYSARPAQNSGSGLGTTISSAGNFGSDNLYGAEVAAQWNAFGATAEYMQLDADRSGAGLDGKVTGGYVDLFWSPTGESRTYMAVDGSWGRVTPRATLGADGIGHVMLSGRYEFLDLSDDAFGVGAAGRGEQTGYNLGVTWMPIGYVKFQLNYGMYELDRPGTVNDQDIDSMTFRTQFDW